ncbi:MAG: InlB B-repeat-containing protein [Treponema sp.]|jgi:hypothetical protein|nr:InlB B-repeat-containing protein [Treponema sp.]
MSAHYSLKGKACYRAVLAAAAGAAVLAGGCNWGNEPVLSVLSPLFYGQSVSAYEDTATGTTADLNFSSGEAGTYFAAVYPPDTKAPESGASLSELISKEDKNRISSAKGTAEKGSNTVPLEGLRPDTECRVHLAVKSASGGYSEVWSSTFTPTAEKIAPKLSNLQVLDYTDTATGETAMLSFKSDEAGTYFAVLYPSAAEAPVDGATLAAVSTGIKFSSAAKKEGSNQVTMTGLTKNIEYKVHLTVKDAVENYSKVWSSPSFTPTQTGNPEISKPSLFTSPDVALVQLQFTFTSNKAGTCFLVVCPSSTLLPVSEEDGNLLAAISNNYTLKYSGAVIAGVNTTKLGGLTGGTNYRLYVTVMDERGNYSNVLTQVFTSVQNGSGDGGDDGDGGSGSGGDGPVLTDLDLTYMTNENGMRTAIIQFTSSKAGTYFVASVPLGADVPTNGAELESIYNGVSIKSSGGAGENVATTTVPISNLTAIQMYRLYLTVKDYAGNYSQVWSPSLPSYRITYDANGGTVSPADTVVTFTSPYTLAVPDARAGFVFAGWWTGDTQLTDSNGASLAVWTGLSDTTVLARWLPLDLMGLIPVPMNGAAPSAAHTGSPDGYTIGPLTWKKVTGSYETESDVEGVFEAGLTYRARFTLTSIPNGGFANLADGTWLNGQGASTTKFYHDYAQKVTQSNTTSGTIDIAVTVKAFGVAAYNWVGTRYVDGTTRKVKKVSPSSSGAAVGTVLNTPDAFIISSPISESDATWELYMDVDGDGNRLTGEQRFIQSGVGTTVSGFINYLGLRTYYLKVWTTRSGAVTLEADSSVVTVAINPAYEGMQEASSLPSDAFIRVVEYSPADDCFVAGGYSSTTTPGKTALFKSPGAGNSLAGSWTALTPVSGNSTGVVAIAAVQGGGILFNSSTGGSSAPPATNLFYSPLSAWNPQSISSSLTTVRGMASGRGTSVAVGEAPVSYNEYKDSFPANYGTQNMTAVSTSTSDAWTLNKIGASTVVIPSNSYPNGLPADRGSLRAVAYSDTYDRFVAVGGYYGNVARYASRSGVGGAWARAEMPSFATVKSLAWGNGTFMAVDEEGKYSVSTDGTSWSAGLKLSDFRGNTDGEQIITAGNNTFLLVGCNDNEDAARIAWAYNGASLDWQFFDVPRQDPAYHFMLLSAAYGEPDGVPTFVIVGCDERLFYTDPHNSRLFVLQ